MDARVSKPQARNVKLTPQQQGAIDAPGNVLVMAGAGSGKTTTLVERCLCAVLHESAPVGVDEMVVVTFTDAAAAEVRKRIRQRLEEALKAAEDKPTAQRLERQLALLESANISTLHSFCLRLVREHFHDLELDPVLIVLRKEQARLMMEESLDEVLNPHFEGKTAEAEAVQALIEVQGGGREQTIRELVLRLHEYTQTLVNPEQWMADQQAYFRDPTAGTWQRWLEEAFADWRDQWLPALDHQPEHHPCAHSFAARLRTMHLPVARSDMAALLGDVCGAAEASRGTKKAAHREAMAGFFEDAAFLHSLAVVKDGDDPLAEDWHWVRRYMETLLLLAQEFERAFAQAKRQQGAVDFHDLEQFALRLLLNPKRSGPSALAEDWRRRIKLVLVDEYQDINGAQDAILRALARDREHGNSFLVGDVKQSIYRFRLANPAIFQNYKSRWSQDPQLGKVVSLSENFRSAKPILDFVNALFGDIMRAETGGVTYDGDAQLVPGEAGRPLPAAPCVELLLRLTEKARDAEEDDNATNAELEARMVAQRLRELHDGEHPIWDSKNKRWRVAAWKDMAVLLRSPGPKADVYVRELGRAKIPLQAERGGLFESTEVTDLLGLLQTLDNPLQDVELLSVLRSPLVGLSLDELAEIRIAQRQGYFWAALQRWHEINRGDSRAEDAWNRVDEFLKRFSRWRQMARQSTVSQRLETVLTETNYLEWLSTQPRAVQQRANVERFMAIAQQFDPFQRQGLQRFLRFVEAQREAETDAEPPALENTDAVTLLSIHRSKGLEFPVVVLADLGKAFNFRELREPILLDRNYGLCPHVKPPGIGSSYPSLPYWMGCRAERRELLGEELRLLYVALTRARDTLLLAGSVSRKVMQDRWPDGALDAGRIGQAKRYLDWLGPWCTRQIGDREWVGRPQGDAALFRWRIYDTIANEPHKPLDRTGPMESPVDPAKIEKLIQRIEWNYPAAPATRETAKLSVSALRARDDDEQEAAFRFRHRQFRRQRTARDLSAADIGTSHHLFLQMLDLGRAGTVEQVRAQAEEMVAQELMLPEQMAALDLSAVALFWQSRIGRRIAAAVKSVHREIPFTARFTRLDLIEAGLKTTVPDGEFIVVQGTIDLAVILPGEIWIADFKTDAVAEEDLLWAVEDYAPQLRLYASALSRIYRRPVTARWIHFLALSQTIDVPASAK